MKIQSSSYICVCVCVCGCAQTDFLPLSHFNLTTYLRSAYIFTDLSIHFSIGRESFFFSPSFFWFDCTKFILYIAFHFSTYPESPNHSNIGYVCISKSNGMHNTQQTKRENDTERMEPTRWENPILTRMTEWNMIKKSARSLAHTYAHRAKECNLFFHFSFCFTIERIWKAASYLRYSYIYTMVYILLTVYL